MPYIVTVTGDPHEPRERTAFATLNEARTLAAERSGLPWASDQTTTHLPDGTVIEVRAISGPDLATLAGTGGTVPDLVARFNARQ